MKRTGKIGNILISISVIFVLLAGPGATVSRAEVLSGANGVTLVREPQQTPDGLGSASFNGLQYANPAAQIDLVQPPVANNQGDAEVTHPLSVPPGRAGLQPDLSLNYSSSGGNSWVGLGWDLSLGAVTIDTRWGVPHYYPNLESESYILDGDSLAPMAVQSTLQARQTDRTFTRRVEGQFERIIRHGNAPGSYWWEVTDKSGTTRYYGATQDGVRDPSAILPSTGNEFEWALRQVRDISGNTMTFNYVTVTGSGVGATNASLGQQMYLDSIQYTGSVASGVPDDPAYEVRFVRASQLGEAIRPDVSIDARGGFLQVTSDLLRNVDVYYRGTLTKRYILNYTTGPFGKSLLANVVQAGSDGVEYARHTFQYYNDVGYNGSNAYQGFNASAPWDTQNDGVGNNIDLGAFGNGNASAMGGVQSVGADGRVYLGFNPEDEAKEGSFGAGLSFGGENDSSLLEMVDINGDNLPDKVFKDGSGFSYRLNTSGPNGTTTFGPKQPILGINTLSRENNFSFGVGPEAYFGVELMYNHAWTWTWGKSYFIDVNSDGLVDLVDNGTVYFNHGEVNGQVSFSQNSADTSVPLATGTLDPSVLPDLSSITSQEKAQAPLQDTLRRWTAPWDGEVTVSGDVALLPNAPAPLVISGTVSVTPPTPGNLTGDGVRVAIQHNGGELWSTTIPAGDYNARTPDNVSDIPVSRGDHLYFRVGSVDDGADDLVSWDPVITYLNETPTQDANGLDVYTYQGSTDFTLAGYNDLFGTVPLTGTLHVEGDFIKTHKTTDDITVEVLHNNAVVDSQIVTQDMTGTLSIAANMDVLPGDQVQLEVKTDSPVDLSAFSWTPQAYYTAATQNGKSLPVYDSHGQPIIKASIPVATEIYPRTDLTAPQTTWTAPATETITATASVAFATNALVTNPQSGTVAITVKKVISPTVTGDPPSELVAKQILTVQNGIVTNADPAKLQVNVDKGARYWFDLSVGQPTLGSTWVSGSIDISNDPNSPDIVPSARHWSYLPQHFFPPAYRGWGYAGYNAADGRENAAIDESRLVFDKNDYPSSTPQLNDPNNPYPTSSDVDPNYKNPINSKAYFYAPYIVRDQTTGDVQDFQWRGSKVNLFGAASTASSSRLGPDSIGLPTISQLAGASGVTRMSTTQGDTLSAGIAGVGGAFAWGHSEGSLDFFDMNGDQFPDVVGSSSIQYTTPRGALDGVVNLSSQLSGYVRQDKTTTKSLSGGGTAAKISADSKGNSNTSQAVSTSSALVKRNQTGKGSTGHAEPAQEESGSISLAGSLGWSSTNTSSDSPTSDQLESDLGDVNGDGLPDRITTSKDGSVMVAFNLGYGFSQPVLWSSGGFEQGKSNSISIGPSLSFEMSDISFGGGVSLSGSTDNPITTWVDLNGDGLIDQLQNNNGTITVRINTGAGLSAPVTWGAFQQNQIAQSHSVSLGGGADFTIGIGPLCEVACYLIINPGFDATGGMSRQEIGLYDVNGDGYADSIYSTADHSMDVSLNTTGRTNLLKSVSNPLGGTISLDYTRKGNTTAQAYSQWVMSSVAVNDGRPGDGPDVQLTTYQYGNNVYDALERAFLGYDSVTEEQRDTSQSGNPVLRSYVRTYLNANVFDNGLLESETLEDGAGNAIKDTVNTWSFVNASDGTPADLGSDSNDPANLRFFGYSVFPQMTRTDNHFYNNGAVAKSTYTTFEYDLLGNITTQFDAGEPDLTDDNLTAITTYSDCTASSWVSLPQTFVIKDGSGNVLRSRQADDQLCINGAVTKLTEDLGNGQVAETDLSFDAWGNYNQIIYPENATGQRYQVDYVYDADRHSDIAQVSDSFGLTGGATYDGMTGQITSQTDANGQVTSYTYDTAGRLASITGPYEQGSGQATVSFEYHPTDPNYAYGLAHLYDAFHPGDTIDTAAFVDGIDRQTQTKQDATMFRGASQSAEDVMIVSGATEFDALGRAVKQWYPTEEALGSIGTYNSGVDSVAPTQYEWSLTDHITKVTTPDGSVTTTNYGYDDGSLFGTTMFLVTRTDPLGGVLRTYSDVHNNLLASEVNHNGTPLRTTYTYDPLQELLTTTDPGGNVSTNTYDLLGRRTSTETPDGGLVEFTYDPASQVTSKVTPNLRASGGQVSYSYDYNHLTGINYTDGTPGVSYTYGGPGAAGNGAGRIVQIDDGARHQELAFGPLGEVTNETTTMQVHNLNDQTASRLTWTTSFDYDTWGRPKTITYPDGEVVSYGYDSGGLTNFMAGTSAGQPYTYVTRMEYDKFLARRYQETGNGVTTEVRYNAETRRLEQMISNNPNRQIQDITYGYDLVGNVLTADNAAPTPVTDLMGGTSSQSFTYDDIYQLTDANGTYNFAPNNKHRDYTYSVTLDNLGNILQKDQTDTTYNNPKGTPQKDTTYSQAYTFGAPGTVHAPIHIGEKSYSYDLNGNLTGWTDDYNGTNRTVTWDAENRVTSVADQGSTTRYTYDDQNNLAIQRGPQGEISFVNRYYTVHNGAVAWKNYWIGSQRIATQMVKPNDNDADIDASTTISNTNTVFTTNTISETGTISDTSTISTTLDTTNDYDADDGVTGPLLFFFHQDLLSSTNFVTDRTGEIYEYLLYFPSGEVWVQEHKDIYRTPYLYTGSYLDEFRDLNYFGARWYAPQEQMLYSPDPTLVQIPDGTIDDPALLSAYTYAENNPTSLVDHSGMVPINVQDAFRAYFATPNGRPDSTKVLQFSSLVQQAAEKKLGSNALSRLAFKVAANPKESFKSAYKAIANFGTKPVLEINLTKTDDGFKLKSVKLGAIFKQFKVVKRKP